MKCFHCRKRLPKTGLLQPRFFDLFPLGLLPPITQRRLLFCQNCGHTTGVTETLPYTTSQVKPRTGDFIRVCDCYGRVRRITEVQ